jgi:hypothetical protein
VKPRQEQPRPTFEQFVAQCRESFAFLKEFNFESAPLPKRDFINEFQARFTNGKIFLVSEGINWGYGADVYVEDTTGVKVPLVLFIPPEQRKIQAERLPGESAQLHEIRSAGQRIKEHCIDLLRGDMTRFYERSAEWQRITGHGRPS